MGVQEHAVVLALWGWSVEVISLVSWASENRQPVITPWQSAEHSQHVLLRLAAGGLQVDGWLL